MNILFAVVLILCLLSYIDAQIMTSLGVIYSYVRSDVMRSDLQARDVVTRRNVLVVSLGVADVIAVEHDLYDKSE